MIVSKPKASTIFSLSAFLVIAYGLAIWSIVTLPESEEVPLYRYLISIGISLVAVLVTIKVFWGYQTIRLNRDRWRITYLLRPGKKDFKTNEIAWWKVTTINTKGGIYEELHIHTERGKNVKLSPQEHTSYQQILNVLQKKCSKKRVKAD